MAEEEDPRPQRFNARPESTIVQNFASDLDAMFGLDAGDGVQDLHRTVEEKKQVVNTGEQQLQALEAKLRETEERLARVSRHSSPARPVNNDLTTANPDHNQAADGAPRPSPLAQPPTYPADRPPTSGDRPQSGRADTQAIMAGTPAPQQNGGSNDSYVMVDRSAAQPQRSYG